MKILFITPTVSNRYSKKKHKFRIKRGLLPPLGIGYLAATLIKQGYEVKIIDSQVEDYTLSDIIDEINLYKPDVIGISFLTFQAENAYSLIYGIKRKFEDIFVIAGGVHPTIFPEETMAQCRAIDILVVGEGENTILEIMERLKNGRGLNDIKGIYFRNNDGIIIKNPASDILVNLDSIPFPARELYSIYSYAPEPFENKKLPSTSIIASRGCNYAKCSFCYRAGSLKRICRYQSPSRSIEEIKDLVNKFGIREVVFFDDNFPANRKWFLDFCTLLKQEKLTISWSFHARPDAIDYELLENARDVGCFSISLGFESGNQDLLDKINKGITLEQSYQAARWANDFGIEVVGTFMLALPGETPEKARQTVNFALELNCTYAAFIPTHPSQGTELYEQCLSEGKLIGNPYCRPQIGRIIPNVVYVPRGYKDKEEVEDMVRYAYRKFYLRPSFLLRHLSKIRYMEDIRRYWDGINFFLNLVTKNGQN